MSKIQLGKALITIESYDSTFKVDTWLHEPLWKYHFTAEEISLEILSLLSELEPLCNEEYTKASGGIASQHRKEFLCKFIPLANVTVGKMREYLNFLPYGKLDLKDYLKKTGLAVLFPRTSSYVFDQKKPAFNQKSAMDGYFSHMAILNQLANLSNQLNCDVSNLANHKYVAHQIALLYQAVNQVSPSMSYTKKQIEENFKHLKESLANSEKDRGATLPRIHKEWIKTLTAEISNELMSEPYKDQSIRPIAQFLTQ